MQKAFTLVELLVVVLIVAILSAVALPRYKRVVERAKYIKMITAARTLNEAQQRYILANGKPASKLSDLDISFSGTLLNGRFTATDKQLCGDYGAHPKAFGGEVIDMGDYELGIGGIYSNEASIAMPKDSCKAIFYVHAPRQQNIFNRPLCYIGFGDDGYIWANTDWCSKTFGIKYTEQRVSALGGQSGSSALLPY